MPQQREALATTPAELGPVHAHLTIWLDRPPEIYAPGIAPWLVLAALYEITDALAAEGTEDPEQGPDEQEE